MGAISNVVGIICPPPALVGIGLTDLPKSGGGGTMAPPAPTSLRPRLVKVIPGIAAAAAVFMVP